MIDALSTIKLVVQALCRESYFLVATFKCMVDTLIAQKSKISIGLINAIN